MLCIDQTKSARELHMRLDLQCRWAQVSHAVGAAECSLAHQGLADAAASTDSAQQLVDEATALTSQVPLHTIECVSGGHCSAIPAEQGAMLRPPAAMQACKPVRSVLVRADAVAGRETSGS